MPEKQPVAELIATTFETYDTPTPRAEARRRLHNAHDTYWLATTRPSRAPHVRPVLRGWPKAGSYTRYPAGHVTRLTLHVGPGRRAALPVTGSRRRCGCGFRVTRVAGHHENAGRSGTWTQNPPMWW